MDDITERNYEDLPINKYIICIDSTGIFGRKAAQILFRDDYLALYVQGGYEIFTFFLNEKEI